MFPASPHLCLAVSHLVGFPSGCHDNPLHTESCKPLPPSSCLPEKPGHVLLLKDEQSTFQGLLVQAEHLPPPSPGACLTKFVSDVSSHLLRGASISANTEAVETSCWLEWGQKSISTFHHSHNHFRARPSKSPLVPAFLSPRCCNYCTACPGKGKTQQGSRVALRALQ